MKAERVEFHVGNLDCENDASRLRRGLESQSGVKELRVFPKSAKVSVTVDSEQISTEEIRAALARLGFPVKRRDAEAPRLLTKPKVLTSLSSGLLLGVGWISASLGAPPGIAWALYLASLLTGGYFFGREALEELWNEREVGIELLMLVAAVVATAMGEPMEGAMLAFLYSISEAAEGFTEEKTRSAIRALMDLAPKVALIRRDGRDVEVPIEALALDDVFLVRPGQSVPTDGVVLTGESSLNQAPVTGESVPVEKSKGDRVFAGSINGEGALEVKVTATFANNTIARIIQMVEEAQEKKGKSQRFIERFGRRYSPLVLLAGVLLAFLPPLLLGWEWSTWLTRATVFIVAAAPCALVISIPITLVATLGTAARHGVLIKGGIYLEQLADIEVVALDKTGTLTRGEPEVTDLQFLLARPPRSEEDTLTIAAGVERASQHPLAQAIVRYVEGRQLRPVEVDGFRSLTGAGASGRVGGLEVFVGSPSLFAEQGAVLDRGPIEELQSQGKTVVLIGQKAAPWALFAIRDNLRPNARLALQSLRAAGVKKVVMLSGDNQRTAEVIAREVGIDEVYAGLKPEDKVARVRELAKAHGHVAMVGDGVNDAPALAEANIGVAMGVAGTDVALETADVALMGDDLERLAFALQLAKRNRRVVRQNLVLSGVVIVALVAGALAGQFTLPIAVLAHEISEFIVIGSGLRMLRG